MGPGFIRGVIVGAAASALVLSALSLSVPLPSSPAAGVEAPDGVAGGAAATDRAEVTGPGPDADLVELPPTAPETAEDGTPETAAMESSVTAPAAVPEVGGDAGALTSPTQPVARASVDIDTTADLPVAQPPAAAPAAPGDEVALSISTLPAQPLPPEVSEEATFAAPPEAEPAPQVDAGTDPALAAATADDMAEPDAAAPADPAAQTAPAAMPQVGAPAGDLAAPDEPDAMAGVNVDADQPGPAPSTAAAPTTSTGEQSLAVSTAPAEPLTPIERPAEPRLAALPQVGLERTPGTPDSDAAILPGAGTRLPGNGQAAPGAASPDAPKQPPIVANAEPFDNPDGKPLMAIVLIDEPGSIGAEALADFPYPLTFALDPTAPGAVEKMRAHRAVGFEVVALVDLPLTAAPADAEVSLSIWLDTLDQAVAVMEGTETGFQGNRPLSDQVTDIVEQEGFGLITQDNGLNTVQKLAAKHGVPSTVIFRDFDGAGQTPSVMRRFLDQAAFRAAQQGAVVMLGRMRPDTVSALLLWGLQDRASRVALAPISAVLTREAQ